MDKRASQAWGHRVFFPVATVYAGLVVPLWALDHLGVLGWGWTASRHAHEMVAGYALAVVAGFLMTRLERTMLSAAVLAWLAGRAVVWLDAPVWLAAPSSLLFPCLLFALAGMPFFRNLRSAHNAVFGPLIGAFAVVELMHWVDDDRAAFAGLLLVGTLLFAMGGRVIPAATAGEIRRQGGRLEQRGQRELEWLGVAGAALAIVATALGGVPWLAAAGAVVVGVCGLVRLAQWRSFAMRGDAELLSLHLGYLAVSLGWIGIGLDPLAGSAEWHVLAIGGLGILANAMMVRVTLQREAQPNPVRDFRLAATGLLLAAAAFRLLPSAVPYAVAIAAAAVCWTLAHLLSTLTLVTIPRRRSRAAQP